MCKSIRVGIIKYVGINYQVPVNNIFEFKPNNENCNYLFKYRVYNFLEFLGSSMN